MNILECPHCNKKLYIYPVPMKIVGIDYLQRDYKLLSRFLAGERQVDLAREHKISSPRLDQILRRAINKLAPELFARIGTQLTIYRNYSIILQCKIDNTGVLNHE